MQWTRSFIVIAVVGLGPKLRAGEVIELSLHRASPPPKQLKENRAPRFYPACTLTLSPETNWRWPSGLMFLAARDDVEVRRALLTLSITLEPSAAQILQHLMRLVHPPIQADVRSNILIFAPPEPVTSRQIGERARARIEDMRKTLHALDGVLSPKQKRLYANLLRVIFREL